MIKIQDTTELHEIIEFVNNKNYLKALDKTKLIAKNYPNENILLKLFAIIYFNLSEWENAIIYYKKVLDFEHEKYKIYTNIGVAYFKLGKINKSVEAFKSSIQNNPNFSLAHKNLGISYLELGLFEESTKHFVSALKLNNKDQQTQNYLINSFNFNRPKITNHHPLIEINYKINKLINQKKISNKYKDNIIKIILEKSNYIINDFNKELFITETQIFRKNSENLNCGRHFKVFNEFNVIPKYCFSCYKIQINLKTVVDLIKLFIIFDEIKLSKNNTRKCIIEMRNKIQGNYKGYIYCKQLSEAEKIKKKINEIMNREKINADNIFLKHGCSEFYESFPKFEKISINGNEEMKYNENWKSFENIIDSREPKRIDSDKKIWKNSVKGINLCDILIINNWISYAQIIGDESYKKIYDKKIDNQFIKKLLENQLEFRNQSLKLNLSTKI